MAHPTGEASHLATRNVAAPCPQSGKRRGSPVKGQQAIHTPRKSLCATTTGTHEHLFLEVAMRDRTYHALLDSGAQGNFIAPWMVNDLELPWKQKEQPYSLDTVEGSAIRYDEGMVQRETAHLPIAVQNHHETLRFDITDIGDHPMILGIPWLRNHNPTIDWITGQMRWAAPPEQDPPSASATEQDSGEDPSLEPTTLKLMVRHQRRRDRRTEPACDPRPHLRVLAFIKKIGASTATSNYLAKVPTEYHEFAKLFQPELATKVSRHSRFDHEIPLKEGTFPPFKKMYTHNEEKLEALREYLEEHLQKGHIRESTSPAGYPILFVPKKTGSKKKRQQDEDYRKLNEISIKNRRPLPLIGELRDRTQGAKWFTALDLKSAYNLVRIKEGDEWKTAFRP